MRPLDFSLWFFVDVTTVPSVASVLLCSFIRFRFFSLSCATKKCRRKKSQKNHNRTKKNKSRFYIIIKFLVGLFFLVHRDFFFIARYRQFNSRIDFLNYTRFKMQEEKKQQIEFHKLMNLSECVCIVEVTSSQSISKITTYYIKHV